MRFRCAIALLVIGLGGCTSQVPDVAAVCGEQVTPVATTPSEQLALKDLMTVSKARCDEPGVLCRYKLFHSKEGRIVVTANYLQASSTGQCGQAPGDLLMHIYDSNGRFLERGFSI